MTIKTVMMGMLRMVMTNKDDTGRGFMMQRRDGRVSRSQLMEIMTMATMMTKTMKLVIMVGEQVVRVGAGQPMAVEDVEQVVEDMVVDVVVAGAKDQTKWGKWGHWSK